MFWNKRSSEISEDQKISISEMSPNPWCSNFWKLDWYSRWPCWWWQDHRADHQLHAQISGSIHGSCPSWPLPNLAALACQSQAISVTSTCIHTMFVSCFKSFVSCCWLPAFIIASAHGSSLPSLLLNFAVFALNPFQCCCFCVLTSYQNHLTFFPFSSGNHMSCQKWSHNMNVPFSWRAQWSKW